MNIKNLCLIALATTSLSAGLTSCNSEPSNENENVLVTMDFTLADDEYNNQDYWLNVYEPTEGAFGIYPMIFSHKAEVTEYDGVTYKSFTGFCPSRVDDTADHTGDDWVKYQFGSISSPGSFGYIIAHWDTRETAQTPLADRSCLIQFGMAARPVALSFTNTAYTYYTMKNGSAFSRPFTSADFLYLDIYGVKADGTSSGPVSVALAQNGELVDKWLQTDLSALGEVYAIYFMMRSSDTGEWGMNTPAYFAIGSLSALYITSAN